MSLLKVMIIGLPSENPIRVLPPAGAADLKTSSLAIASSIVFMTMFSWSFLPHDSRRIIAHVAFPVHRDGEGLRVVWVSVFPTPVVIGMHKIPCTKLDELHKIARTTHGTMHKRGCKHFLSRGTVYTVLR